MQNPSEKHWNKVYTKNAVNRLGWYEESPKMSLKLISRSGIAKDDTILDIGCGASTLIDHLLAAGYTNITAADISKAAIEKLKERLGQANASRVTWIADNVANPSALHKLSDIALWHDRAVLHFLTAEQDRRQYLSVLRQVVKTGGFVMIAAFSLAGAKKCSGLRIRNYDEKMLAEFLGSEFKLLEHFDYLYVMPSGDERPYVYTLFQRIS